MTTFAQDMQFTTKARQLIERDLYPTLSWAGRFVSLVGEAPGVTHLQRQAHIDAVIQTGPAASITVEEKIVRRKYDAFAIETHANLEGGQQDGWIYTSTADLLIYAFSIPEGLECWLMSLPALRQWFVVWEWQFKPTEVKNWRDGRIIYHSKCRLVPITAVGCHTTKRVLRW